MNLMISERQKPSKHNAHAPKKYTMQMQVPPSGEATARCTVVLGLLGDVSMETVMSDLQNMRAGSHPASGWLIKSHQRTRK